MSKVELHSIQHRSDKARRLPTHRSFLRVTFLRYLNIRIPINGYAPTAEQDVKLTLHVEKKRRQVGAAIVRDLEKRKW